MRNRLDTDFLSLPTPRAIGHRGSAATHPENTLQSFQAAVDAGAPYLELDVHMTRDGEVVVCHDDDVARCCGRSGLVKEFAYRDLARLDAGYSFSPDERDYPFRGRGLLIPRLADVLGTFRSSRFVIEVKQTTPSVVAPMLEVIARAGMRRMVMVASEHHQPLEECRASAPTVPTNFSSREVAESLQAMAARSSDYVPRGDALQIPPEYESWRLATPDTVAFAHRHGIEVHVWTVNEEPEMRELLGIGVDAIISDYPARLLDVLRSRATALR